MTGRAPAFKNLAPPIYKGSSLGDFGGPGLTWSEFQNRLIKQKLQVMVVVVAFAYSLYNFLKLQ